jgi:YD repeat-containing protein
MRTSSPSRGPRRVRFLRSATASDGAARRPRPRRLLAEVLEDRRMLAEAPLLVDLQPSSDSGLFADDNLTNVRTAVIDIIAAQAGDTIRVYRDGTLLGDTVPVEGAEYQYTFAAGQLAEGVNTITARSFDGTEESSDSPPLLITLDTVGPRITASTPASPFNLRSASLDSISVTFTEPIDDNAFTVENANFTGPSGAITATGVAPLGSNQYQVSIPPQTVRGTYRASVGPNITDLAGNPMDQDNDGNSGEATQDQFAFSLAAIDADTIFTTTTTIAEGNTTYEGQHLLINGAAVTINGPHTFGSVHLINGAVLTHTANTTSQTYKVDLTVAEQVVVGAGSQIDVSGKGYLPTRTSGNTTVGGATGTRSGGSHGGLGGVYNGSAPAVYGDYADPNDWGSGGSNTMYGEPSARGGGLVRLIADSLALDGAILADGQYGPEGGGGAGGGIYISVTDLLGTGRVSAAGGNGLFAAGGGGRVAVYAHDSAAFAADQITTFGGTVVRTDAGPGGAGTVYLRDADEAWGTLIVDAGSGGTGTTPLGLPGETNVTISDAIVVRGSKTRVRPEHVGMAWELGGSLTIENSAVLEVPGSLTSESEVVINGGTLLGGYIQARALSATNGARLTTFDPTTSAVYKLELTIAETLVVDSTSKIDVSGKGYQPNRTTGNTTVGGATGQRSGGSHGGLGGAYHGSAPSVYGDYTDPNDWGSGGTYSSYANSSASGGGLVRLIAGSLTLNGDILADGQYSSEGGGGAGGGIYLSVTDLAGTGRISAAGGNSQFAAGGGGRVAVYARDSAEFALDQITALGGTVVRTDAASGGAGTVYLRDADEALGTLIVDAGSGGTGTTPLGLPGETNVTIPDAIVVRGSKTRLRPEHSGMMWELGGTLTVENSAYFTGIDGSMTGTVEIRSGGVLEVSGLLTSESEVVINGGTLRGGQVHARALSATNGALLSTFDATTSAVYKLELTIAGTFVLDSTSQIDVSGKGYLPTRTSGNTTVGGATGTRSGGSHGGLGGVYNGSAPAVYGDYADPNDWGSGGSNTMYGEPSARGGGLVRLIADSLALDGAILADGQYGPEGGGGAGGGIYISVTDLLGTGRVSAAGGNGLFAAGGGGRVAVYAHDSAAFAADQITTFGGTVVRTDAGPGGAGTVYLRDADEAWGTLIVDAGSGGTGTTPLGLPGETNVTISDAIVVRGSKTRVRPEHVGMAWELGGSLTIENSAVLEVPGSLTSESEVVINGGTLLGGYIQARALSATNGARLTTFDPTTSAVYKLELTIAETLVVDSTSKIDVSGKGYQPNRTTGNTTVGGATGQRSGGSHGGLGGAYHGSAPSVYGDYTDPNDWGSGGTYSSYANSSASGGGLVRLIAGSLTLNGDILADGQYSSEGGGGAGGGIYLSVTDLAGTGRISAAGGNSQFAAGGGGRVAVYARDSAEFALDQITALGGTVVRTDAASGGAGTVYLRDADEALGTLIVDAGSGGTGTTPLGLPGETNVTIPDAIVVRGSKTRLRPEHSGMMWELGGTLTVENSAYFTGIDGSMTGTVEIRSGGVLEVSGLLTSESEVVINGGTLRGGQVHARALSATNGALLSTFDATTSAVYKLELTIAGTFVLDSTSQIDVSGKGYLPTRTSGNTTVGGATGTRSGGSHGGLGGVYNGSAPAVYGDYADPNDWGSGGSNTMYGEPSARGGGLVRLIADSLALDGAILADGQYGPEGGGGAGGGIYISVTDLLGTGRVSAAGGNGLFAAGGGGRVAVYAHDSAAFAADQITTFGGTVVRTDAGPGGAGTVYLRDADEAWGTLIVDAGSGGTGTTPLGLPGETNVTISDAIVVRGSKTRVRPEHVGMAWELGGSLTIENSAVLEVPGSLTSESEVVINGGTLLGGYIQARALSATNGARLTTFDPTTSAVYKLELTIAETLVVDSTSKIDVSGKGYQPNRTTGNTTVGGATGQRSGGSHGGLGGAYHGSAPSVYGDYTDPNDWGSGGTYSSYANSSASGGGLVRLIAGSLTLNGDILADGQYSSEGGGGAGGGIYLSVTDLAGTGRISAAGGNSQFAAGGGGRVAVYARDSAEFALDQITALGGTVVRTDAASGGAGTVYLRDADEALGTLIVDAGSGGTGTTPLGLPGETNVTIPDAIVVRGSKTRLRPEHSGMMWELGGTLTVENSAYFTGIDGSMTGTVEIRSGGVLEVSGLLTSESEVVINGGTLRGGQVHARALSATNGALLSTFDATTSAVYKLELTIAGTFVLDSTSQIDVSGKGYLPTRTSGNTTVGGATGTRSGGSHGGLGGVYNGSAPAVYGDYADPNDWGSGGSNTMYGEPSARGGGLVRLIADSLALDGAILADGQYGPEGGGGAGGGIYISVTDLLGTGRISAAGGNSQFAGGGGGRVAVYAHDSAEFALDQITAIGGTVVRTDGDPGGAGTVYFIEGVPYLHVIAHSPLGRNGGFISSELDHVILEFNKAIDVATLDMADFVIDGQMGRVQPSAITQLNPRNYRIDFPALTENGPYHFALLPTFSDTDGFSLDENRNRMPGEPEDAFTWSAVVDVVPPRITNHSPSGDLAGTIASVDIWLSERIDKTTFSTSDVAITKPGGSKVIASSIQEVGLNRFRINFPAQTVLGIYQVKIGPNVADLAGNLLDQDRDGNIGEGAGDVYDATFNLVPVDLGLSDLAVGASQLWAGEPVTVSWTGMNRSGAPLLGDWVDAVYFSADDKWDITDARLGVVPHAGGLGENESYRGSTSVVIPASMAASFHILVRTDAANQQRETNEADNLIASAALPLAIHPLQTTGVPTVSSLSSIDRKDYYAITLGSRENLTLRFTTPTPTVRVQLYLSYETLPTQMTFDERSALPGTTQEITMTSIQGGGTYYVMVYGDQVPGVASYSITAETAPLFVTRINPSRHGNAVPAVAILTGTGFDYLTMVDLVDASGRPWRVDAEFISNTTLKLNGLPNAPGRYTVRVTKDDATASLPNAFEVLEGGVATLATNLVVPGAIAPGFPTKRTVWVEYRNTGTVAMPAPLLQVSVGGNGLLTTDEQLANAIMNTKTRPVGLGSSVQVLGVGSSATPGTLQPGESTRIPVYYAGMTRDVGGNQLAFTLGSLTTMDTTEKVAYLTGPDERVAFERPRHGRTDVDEQAVEPYRVRRRNQAGAVMAMDSNNGGDGGGSMVIWSPPNVFEEYLRIDWREVLAARPESVPADAWGAIVYNLRNDYGDLWADYVAELAGTADYLAGLGQKTSDIGALWGLKVADASAALNPVRYLAGAVDASAPAPGLPLSFSRVYGQDVVSRFRTGVLGRGWTHNWDVFATVNDTGDVVLHGPGGAERFFTRNVNGTYTPSAGDYGRLTKSEDAFRLTETDGTLWQFRADDLLDHVQDTNGNRITLAYNADGLLSSVSHSNGRQLLLQYNASSGSSARLVQLTDTAGPGTADDLVTTFVYDTSGEHLVSVTAPGNRVTEYAYQNAVPTGFVITVTSPVLGVGQNHGNQSLPPNHDEFLGGLWTPDSHALLSVTHPDGTHDLFGYDDRGRLVRTSRDGGAEAVSFGYAPTDANAPGRVVVTDASGRETTLFFGLGGQLAQVRDGDGRIVDFGYDGRYQFSSLTGPGGERYRYTYDPTGNLTGIRDALNLETSFSYEPTHQGLASFTDARGNGIRYEYDTRGNLTAIIYADDTREIFTYDTLGNVTSSTNRREDAIAYTYNALGQVLTKDYVATAGIDFVYAYDSRGNLTSASNVDGVTTMTYDTATDRLARIEYPDGHWFEFTYDAAGRRESRTDETDRVVRYQYDPLGRLDTMTVDGEGCWSITITIRRAG